MSRRTDDDALGASRAKLVALARRVHDEHDAEDVVQDVLSRLLERGSRNVRSVEGWLTMSVRNAAIDARRRAAVHRRVVDLLAGEAAVAELPWDELDDEVDPLVRALVATFGARTCAALLLREVFDVSYDELARDSGRTPTAWRQLLHRAARRLRERGLERRSLDEDEAQSAGICRSALASADAAQLHALVRTTTTARVAGSGRPVASLGLGLGAVPRVATRSATASRTTTALALVNGRYVLVLVLNGHVLCAVPVGTSEAADAAAADPAST